MDAHRLTLFFKDLMYVYEIRSYADIYSSAYQFLVIKQIGDQLFPKIFSVFIPTLISRILSSTLKFRCPNLTAVIKYICFKSTFNQN